MERPTPTGGPAFEPERVQVFVVEQLEADPESGRAQLHYRFDDGPRFTEHLDFGPRRVADPALDEGFLAALRLVHLVAGVSYYKAALPPVARSRARRWALPWSGWPKPSTTRGCGS